MCHYTGQVNLFSLFTNKKFESWRKAPLKCFFKICYTLTYYHEMKKTKLHIRKISQIFKYFTRPFRWALTSSFWRVITYLNFPLRYFFFQQRNFFFESVYFLTKKSNKYNYGYGNRFFHSYLIVSARIRTYGWLICLDQKLIHTFRIPLLRK